MHFFLIRHGQSFANLPDWPQGYVDAGLTDLGRRQVEGLAGWLKGRLKPTIIYASTLLRGIETATRLGEALGMTPVFDDRLREIGNCWPDGSPIPDEALPRAFGGTRGSLRPFSPVCEGTESWIEFCLRVRRFMEEAVARHHEDARIVLVTHSGVIEAVTDLAFGVGHARDAELSMHHTSITHWERRAHEEHEPWLLHGHDLLYHLATAPHLLSGATNHFGEPENQV